MGALTEVRAAAGKAAVKALTRLQLIERNTAGGNATLQQYAIGHYQAMGRKSAALRAQKRTAK